MKCTRFLLSLLLSGLLLAGNPAIFSVSADARSKSFGSSRGAQWSSSTRSTWNRHGGGLLGTEKQSVSGYSKPGLQTPSPSSGYAKPSLKETPGTGQTQPAGKLESSSSGYTKPTSRGALPAGPADSPGASPSSSSGYAKPGVKESAPAGYAKPGESRTSGGYEKPKADAGKQQTFSGGSKFDKQTITQEQKKKSQESFQQYKAEQAKFKNPDQKFDPKQYESNPLYQKGKVYSGFDHRDHYANRDRYYGAQGYHAPPYAFNSAPSFGMFDTLFLFWMLDHMSNKNVAATAYNHSNDPGFQKWRQEVETMSKDNADLKAKLAEMDKQIKSMDGTPKDPGYLPKGVPPEVALSAAALAAKAPEKPVLRLATGQKGGWYDKFGDVFKKAANGLDVQLVNSGGSLANLKLLVEGKADMALVQSDVLALMEKKQPGKKLVSEQADLYPEYVQLIANRDSGIKSVEDIDSRSNVVYVGPKDSGTALTWEGLGEQDPRFKSIPIKNTDYAAALMEVRKNPKALMMFVGGLSSEFLKKAEEEAKRSGKLRLIAVQEKAFKDKRDAHGNPIYKFVAIPSNVYPALQKGWLFTGDVETLTVEAVLVLRTEWVEKFGPSAMDAVSVAILEAKPDIQRQVNAASAKTSSVSPGTSVASVHVK
jgi:TRAP transporter TAXI family solute receptor